MGEEDHALIAGIKAYPGISNLQGPANDAKAMMKWLAAPDGGGVPKANIDCFITSAPVSFTTVDEAQPTAVQIQEKFRKLKRLSEENQKNGLGPRVGRRIWIYMAGHGFGPDETETALLSASATYDEYLSYFHVLGRYNANYFFYNGVFDEIILLMDCCRNNLVADALSLNRPWGLKLNTQGIHTGKRFFAFATKWSLSSRERKMSDGKVHGVFTQLLLDGLRGKAVEPGTNDVTSQSLNNYLKNKTIWQSYLEPGDWNNPEIPKKAEVDVPDDDFTIVTIGHPQTFAVKIQIPPALVGSAARVLDGMDLTHALVETQQAAAEWQVSLGRGSYVVEIPGSPPARKEFTLTGAIGPQGEEEGNVHF